MRRLADEPQHVPLDAERAEHDAGRLVHRLEHRALLDVQLEVRARVDRLERAVRVAHAIELDAVLAQRIDQARALLVREPADVVELQAAARRRRAEQAPAEPRALLVGPVDQLERDRRRAHP